MIRSTFAWFYVIKNTIAWFYFVPTEKIRDTRRWLCTGGKHTATCERVVNFFSLFFFMKQTTLHKVEI